MKPPFRLVGQMISGDTIEVLSDLLEQAKQGEVIGIAGAIIYKQRSYTFTLTGEAARSPTFALGTVGKLQVDIAMKINEEANQEC